MLLSLMAQATLGLVKDVEAGTCYMKRKQAWIQLYSVAGSSLRAIVVHDPSWGDRKTPDDKSDRDREGRLVDTSVERTPGHAPTSPAGDAQDDVLTDVEPQDDMKVRLTTSSRSPTYQTVTPTPHTENGESEALHSEDEEDDAPDHYVISDPDDITGDEDVDKSNASAIRRA